MVKLDDNKSNRRIAFRVYEQVNLFYQKIADNQLDETQAGFDAMLNNFAWAQTADSAALEPSLPYSQSQENDTLNASISASGIAFTCQEALQVGDYLMLRILLLSSMTVVMTCCKVVYCKPSNPYESNRYPYSIGAQFVNMTAADSDLLSSHVDKRKKQQIIVNTLIAAVAVIILAAPGETFGLLASLGHHLLEIAMHTVYLAFEYLEINLDHVIEHLLHTGLHETQVTVFYVLAVCIFIALYYLVRRVPAACVRFSKRVLLFWSRKKSSCLYYWSEQTLVDKIKIVGLATAAIAGYIFLGM